MSGATSAETGQMKLPASAGTRLVVCGAVGLAVGGAVALVAPWEFSVLAGWSAAMAVYVGWVWLAVGRLDAASTERVAMREDSSRAAADLVLVLANVVNLAGVGFALIEASDGTRLAAGIISGLVVLSVSLSWTVIHTVFALRYARLYYEGGGGVEFVDGRPDYSDFAYLAFTLGMAYQVSDTPLRAKVFRRTVLRHTLLSYLFGVVVAATIVNVIAGLFRG